MGTTDIITDAAKEHPSPPVRALPAPAEGGRVETGPVKFGDDWTGLFIRGDDAHFYATFARGALTDARAARAMAEQDGLDPPVTSWQLLTLENLCRLLEETNEFPKEPHPPVDFNDKAAVRATNEKGIAQALAIAALLEKYLEDAREKERERCQKIARRLGAVNAAEVMADPKVGE